MKKNDIVIYTSYGFDLIPCIVLEDTVSDYLDVDYWHLGEQHSGKITKNRVEVIGNTEDFGIDWSEIRKYESTT